MTRRSPNTVDRPVLPPEEVTRLTRELARQVRERDELALAGRELRRHAQTLMRRIHAHSAQVDEVRALSDEAGRLLGAPGAEEGALDALQEYVEARLLWAVAREEPLPRAEELGVSPVAYLSGMGDLVGEVRRLALDALGRGEIARAEASLALMEELFHLLLSFDVPRSLLSLKPKQDAARALLERTRSEVVLARVMERSHPGASRAAGGRGAGERAKGHQARRGVSP
jgi:translin